MALFETLAGIGLGGSLLGGILGAKGASDQASAQRAADRENRDFASRELDSGYARALRNLLGAAEAEQILRQSGMGERIFGRAPVAAGFTPDQQRQLDALNAQIQGQGSNLTAIRRRRGQPDPRLDDLVRQRDALLALAQGDPGTTGLLSREDFQSGGPGVLSMMDALGHTFARRGRENLESFDAGTQALAEQARRIEGGAAGFGAQERTRINTDHDRALANANALAESRLVGRGMGRGTVLTGALNQNARGIEESRQNALGALGDRQIGLTTGIRGMGLNLAQQRSGQRLGLVGENTGRDLALAQEPLNLRTQLFTGGLANPWQQRDTRYLSGASPGGAAFSTFGNLLGAQGGQALNYGMLGLLARNGGLFGGG